MRLPELRALALAALVACSVEVRAAQAEPDRRAPEEIRAELDAVRERIAEIGRRLERERGLRRTEQAALAESEQAVSSAIRQLRETRRELERARQREDELAAQAAALGDQIATHRRRLGDQLRAAYRVGAESRLKLLLNQEDVTRVRRVLALHGYLGRARNREIRAMAARIEQLEAVRAQQRDVGRRLAALAERQRSTRTEREAAFARRRAALTGLEASIRDRSQRLEMLREAESRLESLLDELASALSDIPPDVAVRPFSELRGRLPMPLPGRLLHGFGGTDDGNAAGTLREGWLIEADNGTPVAAVAHGRVAYADWLRGYGMLLILDHGDGYMSLYGRNQSLLAEVGDWVAPGEVVALAGASGGSGRPGLYFQLRRDGQPVDPAGWIRR